MSGVAQRLDERCVDGDGARRRVADDLDRRIRRNERADHLLGLLGRAVGWVAQVEDCLRRGRDDVVGNAAGEPRDGDHLEERKPVDDGLAALVARDPGEALDRPVQRVVREPRPRRMATPPLEGDAHREVADAPGLDLEVGRFEQHREVGVANGVAAVEEGGERVVHRRQLLAAEEEQGDVDRPGIAPRQLAHELERDGDARPSCRLRRTRGPRRPRCGPGRSPGRARCRSGPRARAAAPPRVVREARGTPRHPRRPRYTARERGCAGGRGLRPRAGSPTGCRPTRGSARRVGRPACPPGEPTAGGRDDGLRMRSDGAYFGR